MSATPPEIKKLIDAEIKRRRTLSKQIEEIDGCIYFWAFMYQWRVNLGEITVEQAQEKLEPLKAARNTLKRLSEKRP
jgi:hypothetical protein